MSAPKAITVPIREFSFGDDSDLRLLIGNNHNSFVASVKVSSVALAKASRVFKAMLHGGFAESKPSVGEWVVTLPEDNPSSFVLILYTLHGTAGSTPYDLKTILVIGQDYSAAMCYTAIIADKYDLLSSVQPLAASWMRLHSHVEMRSIDHRRWSGQVLSAAWYLGHGKILQSQIDGALMSAHLASRRGCLEKQLFIRGRDLRMFPLFDMPEGALKFIELEGFSGAIAELRLILINELIRPWRMFLFNWTGLSDKLPDGFPETSSWPPGQALPCNQGWVDMSRLDKEQCLIYQVWCRVLNDRKLLPLSRLSRCYEGSVGELDDQLMLASVRFRWACQEVPLAVTRDRDPHTRIYHYKSIRHAGGLDLRSNRHYVKFTALQKAHLERQRKVSGL